MTTDIESLSENAKNAQANVRKLENERQALAESLESTKEHIEQKKQEAGPIIRSDETEKVEQLKSELQGLRDELEFLETALGGVDDELTSARKTLQHAESRKQAATVRKAEKELNAKAANVDKKLLQAAKALEEYDAARADFLNELPSAKDLPGEQQRAYRERTRDLPSGKSSADIVAAVENAGFPSISTDLKRAQKSLKDQAERQTKIIIANYIEPSNDDSEADAA